MSKKQAKSKKEELPSQAEVTPKASPNPTSPRTIIEESEKPDKTELIIPKPEGDVAIEQVSKAFEEKVVRTQEELVPAMNLPEEDSVVLEEREAVRELKALDPVIEIRAQHEELLKKRSDLTNELHNSDKQRQASIDADLHTLGLKIQERERYLINTGRINPKEGYRGNAPEDDAKNPGGRNPPTEEEKEQGKEGFLRDAVMDKLRFALKKKNQERVDVASQMREKFKQLEELNRTLASMSGYATTPNSLR